MSANFEIKLRPAEPVENGGEQAHSAENEEREKAVGNLAPQIRRLRKPGLDFSTSRVATEPDVEIK